MSASRVLLVLAVLSMVAGVALLFAHAFSYVVALAVAVVFALGALVARGLRSQRRTVAPKR